MKKIKLLIPALGTVAALSAVAPAVSCGTPKKEEDKKTYKVALDETCADYFTLSTTKIEEGHDLFLTIVPKDGYGIRTSIEPVVTVGTTTLDAEKVVIDKTRVTPKTLPMAIKADDINGDISIAIKQQNLSLVQYEKFTEIFNIASVSVDGSEKDYLEESDLEEDIEHTFTYTAKYYGHDNINLYVRKLQLFDTKTGVEKELKPVDPLSTETLDSFEYTYDLSEGIYTDYKTIIIGAGTFTKDSSYTLKAELDAAYRTTQNIKLANNYEQVQSKHDTTEGVENGIYLSIRDGSRAVWSFDQYNEENYSAWLLGADPITGEPSQIPLKISKVTLEDSNKLAIINLDTDSLWRIWFYENYYDLFISSSISETGGK